VRAGEVAEEGGAQWISAAMAATTQKTADLTAFVQNLLLQMQTRFQAMSESIITKIDEMGSRIDDLERSIAELVKESGHADAMPPSPSNSSYQQLRGAPQSK
jgi:heat shock factor-binding protein 1